MTNPERAQQLWPLLVLAARNQQVLSYEMIGQMTGMAQDGLGGPLGFVFWYCQQQKFPLLNVLAISKKTGTPTFGGESWGGVEEYKFACGATASLCLPLARPQSPDR